MSFYRQVAYLCAGFKTYREIRDIPLSSSIKYLLKLMCLLTLIALASFVPWMLSRGREGAKWVDKNLPVFWLKEGQVVTDVKQPVVVSGDNFLFVLDTTGKTTVNDARVLQGMIVRRDSVIVWFRATNSVAAATREVPLRGFPDGRVNGEYVLRLLRSFLVLAMPMSWLVMVLVGMLTALLQAYLFSFVASLMERTMPSPLRLSQLLNIAIHAVTPPSIVVTAYMAMRLEGLNLWLIYLIVYGIFLIGATTASRGDARGAVEDDEVL